MIRIFFFAVLISFCNLSFAEVTVVQVSENRVLTLKKDNFSSSNDGLTIEFEIKDSKTINASKYMFELVSAKDNLGTKLQLSGFRKDKFQKIDRKFMFFGNKNVPKDMLKFKLNLSQTNRLAKTVDVNAKLKLTSGNPREVIIKNVSKMKDKLVNDPVLKKAGVKLKIGAKSGFGDDKNTVSFQLDGKKDAVGSYVLIDKTGKEVSNGSSSFSFLGNTIYSLSHNGEAGISLKIVILEGFKEVAIPLKIKGLKLP